MPPSSTVLTVASRHREVLTVRSSAMWWVFVLLLPPVRRGFLLRLHKGLANEAFEKVESYGLVPNMINYLMKDYKIGVAKGTTYSFFGLQHPVLLLFWFKLLGCCAELLKKKVDMRYSDEWRLAVVHLKVKMVQKFIFQRSTQRFAFKGDMSWNEVNYHGSGMTYLVMKECKMSRWSFNGAAGVLQGDVWSFAGQAGIPKIHFLPFNPIDKMSLAKIKCIVSIRVLLNRFSPDGETSIGLVQHEGGPCGVLATIQHRHTPGDTTRQDEVPPSVSKNNSGGEGHTTPGRR
ncbi:hypothetical protein E3N88_35970 [Mikania micrantha]|uniref:Uncharacterized protein n=1 Tax=Mikania micrantha TaxID=192012 RepID=A0A5N6M2E2_9ASTR|nr:hypothetical protein E3N88_35970 [Mikania micrantha]